MKSSPKQNLQPRYLLLLLPIALLALASYALDLRSNFTWPLSLQSYLITISRIIFPGFFALGASFLVPTTSRSLQLFVVFSNYFLLTLFCQSNLPEFFAQPTTIVLSSLSATLALLPDLDLGVRKKERPLAKLWEFILAFSLPTFTLLILFVVVTQLNNFIALSLSKNLVSSLTSCIVAPIYILMQALGFSSILNAVANLQYNSIFTTSVLNSVVLTNLIALPIIILTRASISQGGSRLFLCFFGLVVALTSHIGTCISIELCILLLFFQGSFISLCVSSIGLFFLSLYYKLPALSNFFLLYQPDLSFKHKIILLLPEQYLTMFLSAIAIPFILQIIMGHLYVFKSFNRRRIGPELNLKLKLNSKSNPDLYVIAILRSCGGLSNLRQVSRQGRVCYIKVNNPDLVSYEQLNKICHKRTRFERNNNIYILDVGDKSAVITQKLKEMIAEVPETSDNLIPLSQEFIIRN